MELASDFSVILLAAGNSNRMGKNKIFEKIADKTVLNYSLDKLVEIGCISKIVVVYNMQNKNEMPNLLNNKNLVLVEGGKTRLESFSNGLNEIETKYVIIHDAARPFFSKSLIKSLMDNVNNQKNAIIPVLPVETSIKSVKNNIVTKHLKKSSLYEVQTPQIYNTENIKTAYNIAKQREMDIPITELMDLVHKKTYIIEGSKQNVKLTTPEDLNYAKYLVENSMLEVKDEI